MIGTDVQEGDLKTNKTLNEQQKTMKVLRSRAKASMEEQGINSLYLVFGFIRWRESDISATEIISPLVLVPVTLSVASLADPYFLYLHEDEIVINPSLAFRFENDFGISLPEFDGYKDSIADFFDQVRDIAIKNGWKVTTDVNLTLLSFLKINMYKDIDANKDRIVSNPIIKALSGDKSEIAPAPPELNNFDHDRLVRPIELFQVVDADASQQDAILLSKKGISFVLQGPPGTGKSQTITNIISEAITDGRKVLFVSEKMAALDVVKKRLAEAGLDDFCLTMHSYKANKKEILTQLAKTLKLQKIALRQDALYKLSVLEEKRKRLNDYQEQLHAKCPPLDISIYEANGRLAKLSNTQDIVFEIDRVEDTDVALLDKYRYLLTELTKTIGKLTEDYLDNPWYGCSVLLVTHELRHDIEVILDRLADKLKHIAGKCSQTIKRTGANIAPVMDSIPGLADLLRTASESPGFPARWLTDDISALLSDARRYLELFGEYHAIIGDLLIRYSREILNLDAHDIFHTIVSGIKEIKPLLNEANYPCDKDIVLKADLIASEAAFLEGFLMDISKRRADIASLLGIEVQDSIQSVLDIRKLVGLILRNPQPANAWFDPLNQPFLAALLEDASNEQRVIADNLAKLNLGYSKDVTDIDCEKLLNDFTGTFTEVLQRIGNFYGLPSKSGLTTVQVHDFASTKAKEITEVYYIIENALEMADMLARDFDFPACATLDELVTLHGLTGVILKNPRPTAAWFDESRQPVIDRAIPEIRIKLDEAEQETSRLLDSYTPELLDIDYRGMLARFTTEYTNIFKHFKHGYRADRKLLKSFSRKFENNLSDQYIVALLNNILHIHELRRWLDDHDTLARELLGGLFAGRYTDWDAVTANRADFQCIKGYFSLKIPKKIKHILINSELDEIFTAHLSLSKLIEFDALGFCRTGFGLEAGNRPLAELLGEMKDTLGTAVKINGACQHFLTYSRSDAVVIDDLVATLLFVKVIQQKRKWFRDWDDDLVINFGQHYLGESTDWDDIRVRIDIVREIAACFNATGVPEQLKNYLVNYGRTSICGEIENKLMDFNDMLGSVGEIAYRIGSLLHNGNPQAPINSLVSALRTVQDAAGVTNGRYTSFARCSGNEIQYEATMADIAQLCHIQEIEATIESNRAELTSRYASMFDVMSTDWGLVIAALEFAELFLGICRDYGLSDEFIAAVSRKETGWAAVAGMELERLASDAREDFDWYANLFDNGGYLSRTDFPALIDKIERCVSNLFLLEEWIDYRGVREQCRQAGLSEFVEKVEQSSMHPDIIVATFFKRFYRLWLDVMIPKFPAVLSFRGRSHESLIDEFRGLDRHQLEISRLRVKERLISRLPDTDRVTSSVDEVGILMRELTKQRKIMPLRKLFQKVPNLLTALKPCLMMSPLSVSLYLQADGYSFDLVIFDEASQVYTEDAIGAIMRAKQVIIAGDNRQLPPTNFFTATVSDNDYDTDSDDEYDDVNAYDSILEEAVNAIPERTLKWHYRSLHEDLIAFSNAKIYNNDLITFPSSVSDIPDSGVEYVYVEGGVYDRGGKKHNMNEAKKVASLVIDHVRKYPHRSLGVVTFSEAQQGAVENAINLLRSQNGQYEKFFTEEKENAFFVKNLENVQGDERDTIIFSIGYAKDQNSTMHMNFGPLSRNGGHRRLNVAITRAKYNVKLVGSIHPTDIRVENGGPLGVRMLRQYIEYAINGPSVLQNEISFSDSIDTESPFEDSVYDYLVKHGYSVATQVGCSGYRIDLAVKHPTLNNIFVLGIECDGATYHSARTARERDRLRQTILEDIGWTIYRIWSTDWIKDTRTEGCKLIEAVRNAIANYDSENMKHHRRITGQTTQPLETYITVEQSQNADPGNPYGFDYYVETDISGVLSFGSSKQHQVEVIKRVVELETPIHFDLLCRRVAPVFGFKRVSVSVQDGVRSILSKNLRDVVARKQDFCWHRDVKVTKVKIPSHGGAVRPINYICVEELAEAMFTIAGQSFGIARNDLYVIAARAFGFNRTGGNITKALDAAYSYLLEQGIVKEIDGKIVL